MMLKDKFVLITGGAGGLGQEIIKQCVENGAHLAVMDNNQEGLDNLKKRFPECAVYLTDITNPEQVATSVKHWFSLTNRIDVLINNAGIMFNKPLVQFGSAGIEKHDVTSWKKVIDVNLNGVFYVTAEVASLMLEKRTKGVIVNISSISSAGNRGQSAYSAAKAAVNALTATWARELGPMGIRVVAIAPGYTDTEATHKALNPTLIRHIISEVPLRRLGRPEEIAAGVLAAVENDFFTGTVLHLNGGMVL
ncbi:MAG: SDR family NAD(P)-dependent oxidoreductase [Calditrichaeota bacterium]|nr:MAG: SDR family NAD(P)-dependent oxidoreductase [Calditrichota bacterium]